MNRACLFAAVLLAVAAGLGTSQEPTVDDALSSFYGAPSEAPPQDDATGGDTSADSEVDDALSSFYDAPQGENPPEEPEAVPDAEPISLDVMGATPDEEAPAPVDEESVTGSAEALHEAITGYYGPTTMNVLYEPPKEADEEAPAPAEIALPATTEAATEESLSGSADALHEAITGHYGPTTMNVLYEPPKAADPEGTGAPQQDSEEALAGSEEDLQKVLGGFYGDMKPTVLFDPNEGKKKAPAPKEETPLDPSELVIPRQKAPASSKERDVFAAPREQSFTRGVKPNVDKRKLPRWVMPAPYAEGIGRLDVRGAVRSLVPFAAYASLAQAVTAGDFYAARDIVDAGQASEDRCDTLPPLLAATKTGQPHMVDMLWRAGVDQEARDIYGNMALHLAAAANDVYLTRALALRYGYLHHRNGEGYTPLHTAAVSGSLGAIDVLTAMGADMAIPATPGVFSSPVVEAAKAGQWQACGLLRELGPSYGIHQAAAFGDVPGLRDMLRRYPASIEEENNLGATPLFSAVASGRYNAARFLLSLRASVHTSNKEQECPLGIALKRGDYRMASLLLEAGADPNDVHAGLYDESLVHRAARRQPLATLRFLLENGADPDLVDKLAGTPLHAAVGAKRPGAVTLLLSHGAKTERRDGQVQTPLHAAAASGSLACAEILLEHGANVHAITRNRGGVLHVATEHNQPAILPLLLAREAVVNRPDVEGRTALHVAAGLGYIACARALVEAGAPLEAPDHKGNTPLHDAASAGMRFMTDWLLEQGAVLDAENGEGSTPLFAALAGDHFGLARRLVMAGADIRHVDKGGRSLAFVAAALPRTLGLEWVLYNGVPVNQPDTRERTPLHAAAYEGGEHVVAMLLKGGAAVDARDVYGRTPLHYAALRGDGPVTKTLINHGANDAVRDSNGARPIHLAAEEGHADATKVLLRSPASVTGVDKLGNNVVHAAVVGGNIDVLRTALRFGGEFAERNKAGQTPSDLADERFMTELAQAAEIVEAVEERYWRGSQIKHYLEAALYEDLREAASSGDVERLRRILGVFPERINHTTFSRTPLHFAALHGMNAAVRILVEHGAALNMHANTREGYTPLQEALASDNETTVRLLAELGADPSEPTALGLPTAYVAVRTKASPGMRATLIQLGVSDVPPPREGDDQLPQDSPLRVEREPSTGVATGKAAKD